LSSFWQVFLSKTRFSEQVRRDKPVFHTESDFCNTLYAEWDELPFVCPPEVHSSNYIALREDWRVHFEADPYFSNPKEVQSNRKQSDGLGEAM
jgi:hypothetical protein